MPVEDSRDVDGVDRRSEDGLVTAPPERHVCLRNEIRWEQSMAEFSRLRFDFETWRGAASKFNGESEGQYQTQLASIHQLIDGALKQVQASLENVDRQGSEGPVYEECRTYDLRANWIRRVWRFFADKFDQRITGPFQGYLRAADEVVWSCYRPAFEAVNGGAASAVPMPYVEPWFSPSATPAQAEFLPPEFLKEIDKSFQEKVLSKLPVPVLRLPFDQVATPWWLVLVAHEVGHFLQYQLLSGKSLVGAYKDVVTGALGKVSKDDAKDWDQWSCELFADLVSVFLVGPASLKAITELELARDASLLAGRDDYPPVAVRLGFLAEILKRVLSEEVAKAALGCLDPAGLAGGDADAVRRLAQAMKVAEASLARLGRLPQDLGTLCGFRREHFEPRTLPGAKKAPSRVAQWALQLLRRQTSGEQTLEAARLAAAGAWLAWERRIAEQAEPPQDSEKRKTWRETLQLSLKDLGDDSIEVMKASHPPGERAGGRREAWSGQAGLGAEFGDFLLAKDSGQLIKGLPPNAL
jgi:hypothetical protein